MQSIPNPFAQLVIDDFELHLTHASPEMTHPIYQKAITIVHNAN